MSWGVLLGLVTHRPVIYDVHEDFPGAVEIREWIPAFLRRPLSFFIDIYERFLAHFVNFIITADDQIKSRLIQINERTTTLFNFPKLDYASINIKREHKGKIVIHPGSICRERGGDVMLNAFRIVRNEIEEARLVLIGNFNTPYGAYFKAKVKKYGLEDSVKTLGYLPHEEVLRLICQSDIGLSLLQPVSKFKKNIPQKIFEYMASGVPSVVSGLPPIRCFMEDSQAGILVPPADTQKIADAIIFLLRHPSEAKKIGENGRKAVLEKYNWEREERKLLKIYEDLIEVKNEG